MIKVRVGVDDADHLQAQGVEASEDQFMIATRINHDGFFVTGSPMIVQLRNGPTGRFRG